MLLLKRKTIGYFHYEVTSLELLYVVKRHCLCIYIYLHVCTLVVHQTLNNASLRP